MNEKRSGLTGIRAWWLGIAGGVIVLAMICGVIISPSFSRAFSNIFYQSGYTMLICAAFIIPISRGYLDLSVLGTAAISGLLSVLIGRSFHSSAVVLLLGILFGAVFGAINGLIGMIFKRRNVLFMGIATACLSFMYRYIAQAATGSQPITSRILRLSDPLLFLLPAIVLMGLFALLAFGKGGNNAFRGLYEKEENKTSSVFVSLLISGALAGFASAIMTCRFRSFYPTQFNLNPSYFLPVLLAGFAIPNVKKSKGAAFIGYISVIFASIASVIISIAAAIGNINIQIQHIFTSFIGLGFVILNALLGTRAAKIEYVSPVKKPQNDAVNTGSVNGNTAAGNAYTATGNAYTATGKSKVAAALLAIFLGQLGVHRYYLGYKKEGGWQTFGGICLIAGFCIEMPAIYNNSLGLMILALVLLLFGLAICIWALVDFIRILTNKLLPAGYADSENRPNYISEPVPTIKEEPVFEAEPVFNPEPVKESAPAPVFVPTEEKTPAPVEEPVAAPVPEFFPAEKPAPASKPAASSQFGALAELASLYEAGLISEEVYTKRKKEIIDNL